MKRAALNAALLLMLSILLLPSCSKKNPTGPTSPKNETTITFVPIPGGTFQMGDVENVGYSNERPVHTVTLTGFEMSVYEITNAQYAKYLNEALVTGDVTADSVNVKGAKGTYSGQEYIYLSGYEFVYPDALCWIKYTSGTFTVEIGKENYPVVYVTWYGSKAFALHYGLDLPTEAEWEYACRGGKQYKYGTDDGTLSTSKANYWDNGIHHPVDVGSYPKNPFGLYDMSGNVLEWCHDWYGSYSSGSAYIPTGVPTGSSRVVRGGGWGSYAYGCRSSYRYNTNPDYRYSDVGFRVVRRVSPQNY